MRPYLYAAVMIVFALALSACRSQNEPPISDSLFIEVLADLHVADSDLLTAESPPAGTRDSVLRLHDVTERDFERTIGYYAEEPEEYVDIYNRVISRLSELQQERRMSERQIDSIVSGNQP